MGRIDPFNGGGTSIRKGRGDCSHPEIVELFIWGSPPTPTEGYGGGQTIRNVRGVGPGSRDPGSGIRDLSPKVAKSNMLQSRRPERPRSSRDHHSKPLGAICRSSASTFSAGATLKWYIRDPGSGIRDPGSRILDPGSGIPDSVSQKKAA